MYEVVTVWHTGEKYKSLYRKEENAKMCAQGMCTAFGSQVSVCVNEKHSWTQAEWDNAEDKEGIA